MKKCSFLLVLLTLATLACSFSVDLFDPPPIATPFPNPATATPNIVQPTSTPIVILPPVTLTPIPPTPFNDTPALISDQLKNGQFDLPGADNTVRTVQFANGQYVSGSDPAQVGYVSLVMVDPIAFGDLDRDGAVDAALIIAENYGGTGVFTSVAVFLNRGGLPVYTASHFIDDRAMTNGFSIANNEIFIEATIHGLNDPGCCPTLPTKRTLRLWDNRLHLSSFSSQTPSGSERIITIDAPATDLEVEKIFSLRGNVTIAPFENNLVYKVYIPGMVEPFTQGPLMVDAPDFGAPGVFELPLNFTAAGYTGPVYITLSDLSAADGSLLALGALFVTVK